MNVCSSFIKVVPETKAEIEMWIKLIKTEQGPRYEVSCTGFKVPQHRPFITQSREDAVKVYERIRKWANAIAWREEHPHWSYETIPQEHINGRKGRGGSVWTFPSSQGYLTLEY